MVADRGRPDDGRAFFYTNPLHQRVPGRPLTAAADPRLASARARGPVVRGVLLPDQRGPRARRPRRLPGHARTTHGDPAAPVTPAARSPRTAGGWRSYTGYPWDGSVKIRVTDTPDGPWRLSLRVPAWAGRAELVTPDGVRPAEAGYATVERQWEPGDVVRMQLPVAPRWTVADPRIDAVRGCVAVERGPLVYCNESADGAADPAEAFGVDAAEAVREHPLPGLGEDVVGLAVQTRVARVAGDGWPYGRITTTGPEPGRLNLIPLPPLGQPRTRHDAGLAARGPRLGPARAPSLKGGTRVSRSTRQRRSRLAGVTSAVLVAGLATALNATPAAAAQTIGYPDVLRLARSPRRRSAITTGNTMQAIYDAESGGTDFWMDRLLARTGNDPAGTWLMSRGRAVFMKTHNPAVIGFGGTVAYWESISNAERVRGHGRHRARAPSRRLALAGARATGRACTPAARVRADVHEVHHRQQRRGRPTWRSRTPAAVARRSTLRATSPYATTVSGNELTGTPGRQEQPDHALPAAVRGRLHRRRRGADPLGHGRRPGQTCTTKVQMGFVANEIPESLDRVQRLPGATPRTTAFATHVRAYNQWWARERALHRRARAGDQEGDLLPLVADALQLPGRRHPRAGLPVPDLGRGLRWATTTPSC